MADMLSRALAQGTLDPVVSRMPESGALAEAATLLKEAERGVYSSWLLSRAIDLCVQHPHNARLQWHVGKLTELMENRESARLCWRGIAERFPNSFNIIPEYYRIVLETFGESVASQLLASYAGDSAASADPERAILIARCRAIGGDTDTALAALDAAKADNDWDVRLAIEKAKLLRKSGRFDDAITLVRTPGAAAAAPALVKDIERAVRVFDGRHADGPPSVVALEMLLEQSLQRRADSPPVRARNALGGIVLIGGTLGGGGAERQLANTALGLSERARHGEQLHGPVSIFCRKLDRRRRNDFYLSRLERADIRVADYLSARPWGGDRTLSAAGASADLVAALPERMREGVVRLTDILRHEAPEVVQIWQDGMIFAAGLAALMAGVPRIVLNVRTMPPNRRTDRQRPEQLTLYRGLLRAEGVSLTANSRIAARAYEEWLDLPRGSVLTIANGVSPLSVEAADTEEAMWQRFDAETGGSGFVLGGVMRFDDNKRPLLWLQICAALAQRLPDARFVIAGHGPLRPAAEELAKSLGILDRTLFVGRTSHVGFWLGKMDALALTSRHEGVPNALIEAQLAGLPVVTTPAGGAPEAVAPHRANLVLADAEDPDADAAAAHVAGLAAMDGKGRDDIGNAVRNWATDRFSLSAMVDRTIDIFSMR